jgi:DedD protein
VAAKPAAAKPAPAKPAPARSNNDYWVQIGAFSAKVRAEGVKETLASRGITTIIDDRDVDGKTLYRVRVGPYTSETEAGYWLALVKEIDGFGDSQIRSSIRK